MDDNLRQGEIINLLDIPYDSEDEIGELIDENDIGDEINDEELFRRLDEVFTLPDFVNTGVPTTRDGDSIEDDDQELSVNGSMPMDEGCTLPDIAFTTSDDGGLPRLTLTTMNWKKTTYQLKPMLTSYRSVGLLVN